MLLEAASETKQTLPEQTTSKYSYSVTETNIFGATSSGGIPVAFLIVAAVGVIIIIAVAIAASRRKPGKQ